MTQDTEKAFKIMFCEYKRRRKFGSSKESAKTFEDGTIPKLSAFKAWNPSDIKSAINELKANSYIAKNIWDDIAITDSGIEYMESKPKEFFSDLSPLFDLISILI